MYAQLKRQFHEIVNLSTFKKEKAPLAYFLTTKKFVKNDGKFV
jgi:hypothetical protein